MYEKTMAEKKNLQLVCFSFEKESHGLSATGIVSNVHLIQLEELTDFF
jgi:hypothetical protein